MSDTLRLLVHELVDGFTDRDGEARPGLLALIGAQLTPGGGAKQEGGGHRKVSGSPSPWDDETAGLWLEVHAGARDLRDRLSYLLFGHAGPNLGSSDRGTIHALRALADLSDAATSRFPSSNLPGEVERVVAGWVRHARVTLGVDAKTIPIGECPVQDEEGNVCGQPLRANPVQLRDVVCWTCGSRWPREQWLLLGATISDTA